MGLQETIADAVKSMPDDELAEMVRELDVSSICWLVRGHLDELEDDGEEADASDEDDELDLDHDDDEPSPTTAAGAAALIDESVLEEIAKAGPDGARAKEVRQALGLSEHAFRRSSERLIEAGYLKKSGRTFGARWIAV